MSSNYRAICLSHDPGIVIGPDLTYDEANALKDRTRFEGHEHCDLVIGRYSYPLIEAACPGIQLPGPSGCKNRHSDVKWIDRDWLRLLATAGPDAHPEAVGALSERGCWPLERVHRLRIELDLPEPSVKDEATGARATIATVTPSELHDAIRTLARVDRKWWDGELRHMARLEGRADVIGRRS